MGRELSEYHRAVADRNRTAVITAATQLFVALGYDRTSLAGVAQTAGVSKATLFKQFATKAALFEAVILAVGDADAQDLPEPAPGSPRAGLLALANAYASLLLRPPTADMIRLVIAEGPKFPELRDRTFDFGTMPALTALERYLRSEEEAGSLRMDSRATASAQLLGMIASAIFWPVLVHPGWSMEAAEIDTVIHQAVETFLARYGA
ncbi:TetR/AcrR family transcriptional regulator [Microbacterium sp.]|uniref:TetR/AcrR family transcriptional regulator n=1 Tax=Microbacterium sp. TaxID=51671 RepID=UPI003F72D079